MRKDTMIITSLAGVFTCLTLISAAVWADAYHYNGQIVDHGRVVSEVSKQPEKITFSKDDVITVYDFDSSAEKVTHLTIETDDDDMSDLGLTRSSVYVINDTILCKDFYDNNDNCITIRTIKGRYDISGEDESLDSCRTYTEDHCDVYLHGINKRYYSAVIIGRDRSWSVSSNFALTENEMKDIIDELTDDVYDD